MDRDIGRVFILSPANCGGKRAEILLSTNSRLDLAARLRKPAGVPVGEVFAFLSGLYFRGKLAYALSFAARLPERSAVRVITPHRGLIAPETRVTAARVRDFACHDIDPESTAYRKPLLRDARRILSTHGGKAAYVLLGSVATGKYVEPLLTVLGERLLFPEAFVGRGDMSRGGLLLRCIESGKELNYVPALGAIRHGARPPRLEPRGQR